MTTSPTNDHRTHGIDFTHGDCPECWAEAEPSKAWAPVVDAAGYEHVEYLEAAAEGRELPKLEKP